MTSSGWRTGTGGHDGTLGHAAGRPGIVWLGLGSNVGDRRGHLAAAVHAIGGIAAVEEVSSVYASDPVGYAEQREFWNLVMRVRTQLDPVALLQALKRIEAEHGRTPTFRNGPREIDIDVLLYDAIVRAEAPIVPHPRMHERGFVLRPLLDLDPGLRDPRDGTCWADRLTRVADQRVTPVLDARLLKGNGNEEPAAE